MNPPETIALLERSPEPKGGTSGESVVFAAGLVVLVALPAAYYLARLLMRPGFWWPLPDSRWHTVLFAWVFALATLAIALPSSRWKTALAGLVASRLNPRSQRLLMQLATVGVGGVLFAHWHKAHGFVGDAAVWTPLADKWFIFGSEPLGRWSHFFAYRFLAFLGMPSNEIALRLSSCCAGMFFLWGVVRFLPGLVPPGRLGPAAALLCTAPVTIYFFGYPSTCPWAYSFVSVYLLAGLHYLVARPSRLPWPESLLIGLAVWSHGMALFATGAQAALILIWLFAWPAATTLAGKARRLLVATLLSVIPFVFLGGTLYWAYRYGTGSSQYGWMGNAGGGIFHRTWIKFGGGNHTWGYPGGIQFEQFDFLGRDYNVGILNVVLFLCPGLLLVPMAGTWLARTDWKQAVFLACALLGLLVLTVFWNPDYGYEWDMRTLSMSAIPAGYLLVLWLASVLDRRRWTLLATLAAATTFAFALVPYLNFP